MESDDKICPSEFKIWNTNGEWNEEKRKVIEKYCLHLK